MNNENSKNLSRLFDVEMDVTVRFGLTEIPLQEVVGFGNGSMIELNRTVDSPVELLVNNSPFAKGEVVVVDGYYSIKITEIDLPGDSNGGFVGNNKPTVGGGPDKGEPSPAPTPSRPQNTAQRPTGSTPPPPNTQKPSAKPQPKPQPPK